MAMRAGLPDRHAGFLLRSQAHRRMETVCPHQSGR